MSARGRFRRAARGWVAAALAVAGLAVAALRVEPLHLVVKAEIEPEARDGDARGLEFLRGRTVNLSEVGSGTYDLAREVLAFAGLRPPGEAPGAPGDYTPATRSYHDLM